jgi:hypothetical protein
MKALGIMAGDAGTTVVRPNDTITRAEVSKVLVIMLGRQNIAQGMAGIRPSFTDEVPTWAWGFVNCAQVMGLVQGYDDGTFKAGAPVTYNEVITMLVRAISGHKEQVAPGFWPYNFLFHAIDWGFTGSVDLSFSGLPAPRGDVARLVFATMQVNKLYPTGTAAGTEIADSAILAGRVENATRASYNLAGNDSSLGPLADSVYLVGAANFEALMELKVIAVKNAAATPKIVVVGKDESAETASGVFKAFVAATATEPAKLEFTNGVKVPYSGTVTMKLNGDLGFDQSDLAVGDECLVTLNKDGKAAYIVALRFSAEDYIDAVTKSVAGPPAVDTKISLKTYAGGPYDVLASSKVTLNGNTVDRDTLAKFDVIKVAFSRS